MKKKKKKNYDIVSTNEEGNNSCQKEFVKYDFH